MNRDFAVMLSIESRLTSIANNFLIKRKILPVGHPLEAGFTLTTPRISNTKFNRSKDQSARENPYLFGPGRYGFF